MHELTLSQSIVDLVVECARKEGVRAVTRVVVEVGIAAGVEPDAMQFCFGLVAADTVLQAPSWRSKRSACRPAAETAPANSSQCG